MSKEKTKLEEKFDEFRDKIIAIQKTVRQIKRSGISESVLYGIIQRNSQRYLNNRYAKPITISQVKAILSGIETLEEYVFEDIEDMKYDD